MDNKVIYVDFNSRTLKSSPKTQNISMVRSFYNKLKNMFTFSSNSKPENGVYNFKKTM
ncbi:hypothetical protein [Clostridium thermarum]|uniref:hypothetical protein n=1 Tax=Clostridium thermarum TaxID=1716543 RepID=UPI0013D5E885|nr:hypothetical protein [Clostridium thermarum]